MNLRYLSILLVIFSLSSVYANRAEVFKDKTSITKPFELRDPFVAPRMKRKSSSGSYGNNNTVFDDTPSINKVKISDISITGVIIGENRRAFAKIKGISRVISLKEGMRIGENNAELKAILAGGIILVEKTVNIYGEEEYLETILPISN